MNEKTRNDRIKKALDKAEKQYRCVHQKQNVIASCASCDAVIMSGIIEKFKIDCEELLFAMGNRDKEIRILEKKIESLMLENDKLKSKHKCIYDRCKYDKRWSTKKEYHKGCGPLMCKCGKKEP